MIELLLVLAAWYVTGCVVLAYSVKEPIIYRACHGFDLFFIYTCVVITWPHELYRIKKGSCNGH